VFISAHRLEFLSGSVRNLQILLRGCGVDARLDLTAAERRQD
jgi:hypothetical protein